MRFRSISCPSSAPRRNEKKTGDGLSTAEKTKDRVQGLQKRKIVHIKIVHIDIEGGQFGPSGGVVIEPDNPPFCRVKSVGAVFRIKVCKKMSISWFLDIDTCISQKDMLQLSRWEALLAGLKVGCLACGVVG